MNFRMRVRNALVTLFALALVPVSLSAQTYDSNGNTKTVSNPDNRALGQTLSLTSTSNAISVALNNGEGTVGFQVVGLAAGGATGIFEGSADGGTTWSAINALGPQVGSPSSTTTVDGKYRVSAGGDTNVRFRVSVVGTGNATVSTNASSVGSVVGLNSQLPPGTNTIGTVNAGTGFPTPAPFPSNQTVHNDGSFPTPAPYPSVQTVTTPAPYVAPTCPGLPNAPCVQVTGSPNVNVAGDTTGSLSAPGTTASLLRGIQGGGPSAAPVNTQSLPLSTLNSAFALSAVCSTPATPTSCFTAGTSAKDFNVFALQGGTFSFQITTVGSGDTYGIYVSNDGVNYIAFPTRGTGSTFGSTMTSSGQIAFGSVAGFAHVALIQTVGTNSTTITPFFTPSSGFNQGIDHKIDSYGNQPTNLCQSSSTNCVLVPTATVTGNALGAGANVNSLCELYSSTTGSNVDLCRGDANSSGTLRTTVGGAARTILTSASATSCTSLSEVANGRFVRVINASATAQTATLTFFDDSGTCATADQLYQIVLGSSQIVDLQIPLNTGLSYTLSAALTNNIVITKN